MQTLKEFNPEAHGLRVAGTPITRKPRTPSSKSAPKPKYADAVWFSFTEGKPLEVSVPVARVEDTIRQLKQAARYLDRSHKPKAEVRVQISVEPELDTDGQPVKRRSRWSSSSATSRSCSAGGSPRSASTAARMPSPCRPGAATAGAPSPGPGTPRRRYDVPWSGPLLRPRPRVFRNCGKPGASVFSRPVHP